LSRQLTSRRGARDLARGIFPAGRRQADREPQAAFEVTLWRALAVFRVVTFAYALILTARNFPRYEHPYGAWFVLSIMAGWSVATVWLYAWPKARTWWLLAADLVVTAACVLASRPIVGEELLRRGTPTLTITWMACPVVAVAIARGRWWGAAAAVAMGSCDLAARGLINQTTLSGTAIMVMAAIAVGHIALLAHQAQERLRHAAEVEAVNRERERLARRRGAELGGEAAELGRLAGEQESALRALVSPGTRDDSPSGMVDLREVVQAYAGTGVTISVPATGVWLRSAPARELASAIEAALENVRRHCPDGAAAWILVEEEPDAVTVTVRDNGPGIPPGRLDQAAAQGRLGVAQSIRGRLADLGGKATVASSPGQGTEVELHLPR
jgi:hypothetical protein